MTKIICRVGILSALVLTTGVCVAREVKSSAKAEGKAVAAREDTTTAKGAAKRYRLTLVVTDPRADVNTNVQISTDVTVRLDQPASTQVSMKTTVPSNPDSGLNRTGKDIQLEDKFDCSAIHSDGSGLAMHIDFEVVSLVDGKKVDPTLTEPVIRQRKMSSNVTVEPGAQKVMLLGPFRGEAVAGSSDGLQVELTATEVPLAD